MYFLSMDSYSYLFREVLHIFLSLSHSFLFSSKYFNSLDALPGLYGFTILAKPFAISGSAIMYNFPDRFADLTRNEL